MSQVTRRPAMQVMEQQPPEQTPAEREAEERWVEQQHRKHCPWWIRLRNWLRKIARIA